MSLTGSTVVDLTPLLHRLNTHGWVQMLGWNGTAWMVGGYGILAAYAGGKMVDLWPLAPFTGGGIYGLDWNGHSWLISGSPTRLALWDGNHLTASLMLPSAFNAWVNVVSLRRSGAGSSRERDIWRTDRSGRNWSGAGLDLIPDPEGRHVGSTPGVVRWRSGPIRRPGQCSLPAAPTILLVGQGGVRQPTPTKSWGRSQSLPSGAVNDPGVKAPLPRSGGRPTRGGRVRPGWPPRDRGLRGRAGRMVVAAFGLGVHPPSTASTIRNTCADSRSERFDPGDHAIMYGFFLIKEKTTAFENYFGTFPGVLGGPPNGTFAVGGSTGGSVRPFPLDRTSTQDLPHDRGSAGGFVGRRA